MRLGAFPARNESLDPGGRKGATAPLPKAAIWLSSPAPAARETAQLLGVAAQVDETLRDIDHGAWEGQSFADLHATDPAGLAAWIAEPARGAPGGESLDDVVWRLRTWLQDRVRATVPVAAITHPMVIRAAIAAAIEIPASATLRVDIAPLTAVSLSFSAVWRLKAIRPETALRPMQSNRRSRARA
jgi:broad specificity phosphatase PhoE